MGKKTSPDQDTVVDSAINTAAAYANSRTAPLTQALPTSKAARTVIELPEQYYLDNFNVLVNFVSEHYQFLLNSDENLFLITYQSLPESCQRLYIRLLTRTKSLFRQSKLNYPEITDLAATVEQLCHNDLLRCNPALPAVDILALYTRPELAAALGSTTRKQLRREQLEQAFHKSDSNKTTPHVGESALKRLTNNETIIEVLQEDHFEILKLLFFGNLYQDLTAFVLRDLGVQTFETYATDEQTLPFNNRAQVDALYQYYACASLYDSASAGGTEPLLELYHALPGVQSGHTALVRRIDRFACKIARQIERENDLSIAAEIYRRHPRPNGRERLARIESKQGNQTVALAICREILNAPCDAEEHDFAISFGARIAKQQGVSWVSAKPANPPTVELILPQTDLSVEYAVAEHLSSIGNCFYVENSLIGGVLGLAIWDIIFAPISGAFYHPFQRAPSDFYETDFFDNRKNLFDKRWAAIDNGMLAEIIAANYLDKKGITNPLVNWRYLNEEMIALALERIPLTHWRQLFTHMMKDLRHHRSGLPDLILFPQTGGYQLIEVKGPGDRLQKNQLRWMRVFANCGIEHSVVHVQWQHDTKDQCQKSN